MQRDFLCRKHFPPSIALEIYKWKIAKYWWNGCLRSNELLNDSQLPITFLACYNIQILLIRPQIPRKENYFSAWDNPFHWIVFICSLWLYSKIWLFFVQYKKLHNLKMILKQQLIDTVNSAKLIGENNSTHMEEI